MCSKSDEFATEMCRDHVFTLILGAAFFLRYSPAANRPSLAIESDEFIPAAGAISWQHLPVREYQHAALPMYFIKASGLIFGRSQLGYRMFRILGTCQKLYFLAVS